MKRLISLVIALALIVCFSAGCGEEDRKLYSETKLSKYVQLEGYKGIEIDTSSKVYENYYNAIIESDIAGNSFYKVDGVVAEGDTVNIDYVGKKDGIAFSGGTAQGQDLKIGSGRFIPGFEEGLVGVELGSTVDLNLTFPEDYGSTELAGKDVVFTVTVNHNYVPLEAEIYCFDLGFDSVEDYIEDAKERAAKSYLLDKVCELATVSEYPAKEQQELCDAIYHYFALGYEEQGTSMDAVLAANRTTAEDYKQSILQNLVPQMMETQMVMYYIFDNEELELDEKIIADQGVNQTAIAESYAVKEIVLDFLYNKAEIK